MIADTLLQWDKADLAAELARRFLDADELLEVFPSLDEVGPFEEELLAEFVEGNWRVILQCVDPEDICVWLRSAEEAAAQERWREECLEAENDAFEKAREISYWEFVQGMLAFRSGDPDVPGGYPAKPRPS